MSSISTSIEDFLKETKSRASLAQLVESDIQFSKQIRCSVQTYPARKRVTGKQEDLGIIYAEARLERSVLIESYRTLETGVSVAGRVTRGRIRGNDGGSVEDTEDTKDTGDTGYTEEMHEKASNGYNIIEGFNAFREEARTLAASRGFFINGNLQQLLALDQILLLVKKQYSEGMLSCIENKNLVCYHNDLKRELLELEMRVEGKL